MSFKGSSFFRGNDILLQYVDVSLWNFLDQRAAFKLQVGRLVIHRATIDLEPKIRTAEENLILLPETKQLFLFAQQTSDHMFAYLSLGTICFSYVLFSSSL